ncbi:C2H2 type zinc-finger-domain-containing protein [Dipodascopsis uninucleata]
MSVSTALLSSPDETNVLNATLYTCNSCGVGFPTSDMQRKHMKTDWHRYNLKRRVASLPPISAELFAERVIQQINVNRESEAKANYLEVCKVCGNKRFTSVGAYETHLLSSKHRENAKTDESRIRSTSNDVSREEEDTPYRQFGVASSLVTGGAVDPDVRTVSFKDMRTGGKNVGKKKPLRTNDTRIKQSREDNIQSIPPDSSSRANSKEIEDLEMENLVARKLHSAVKLPLTSCIFCSASSRSLDENILHMYRSHGLFVPDRDYITDIHGLITYLSEKVSIGNMCLYCSFEGRSLNSVRDHMIAKEHCKIPYDTEDQQIEISEFYDFSSTYPEHAEFENEQWEDVSESDSEDIGDYTHEQSTKVLSLKQSSASQDLILDPSGLELSLPMSGLRIGHRSLQKYYRQSLKPTPELREGQNTVITASTGRLFTSNTRDAAKEHSTKKEWRDKKNKTNQDIRREQRYINNQKHYRDPMLGG